MSTRRQRSLLAAAALATLAAGGAVTWQWASRPSPAAAGVSPLPDLSRWPAAFREELEATMREVKRGGDPQRALARLAALYFANDFTAEAEKALRTLRTLEPANPRWPYLLGVLLSRGSDSTQAEPLFRETLVLSPDYSVAHFQLGQLLATAGRLEEGRQFYAQRLSAEPHDVLATMGMVDIERRSGDQEAAIHRLEELLREKPAAAEARLLLAEVLDSVGRSEEAARHRLIVQSVGVATPAHDPWLDEIYQSCFDPFRLQILGQLRLNSHRVNEALPYLRRAAEFAPDDPEIQDLFAQALQAAGEDEQARAALEQAIEKVQDPTLLHLRLANLLVEQNQEVRAEASLRQAIVRNPTRAELHDALGRLLYQSRRFDEAIIVFQDALRLNPVLVDTHLSLGRALGAAGRRTEAREMIAKAVEMRPAGQEGLLLLGRLDLEDGRLESAAATAERLLEAGADSVAVRALFEQASQQRAARSAATGRLAEAEAIYRRSLEFAPHVGALHGNFGAFLAKQRRFVEALPLFQRYVELAPEDPRAWLFLGTALSETGNAAEAKAAFARGLEVARRIGDAQRVALFEQALGH